MTREELLAKVAWAFDHAQRSSERCASGTCVACGSAAAVDAVLSAVADDLDAQACRPKAWSPSQRTGIAYAANHIRALVEEGKSND